MLYYPGTSTISLQTLLKIDLESSSLFFIRKMFKKYFDWNLH